MSARQFRVLYRDFLFSIVDRELLSTHAKGDASQLLLQLLTLLVCLSVCFCVPALTIGAANETVFGRLSFAWSIEHFLIATTMLIVGVSPTRGSSSTGARCCPSLAMRSSIPGTMLILVEIALAGAQKIPCACSYLPGKSHVHLAFCVAAIWLLALVLRGAQFALDALQDRTQCGWLLGGLVAIWIGVRRAVAWLTKDVQPMFDDAPAGRAVTLELWDSRFTRSRTLER